MKSVRFDPENSVDFQCPFCGLHVVAGMVLDTDNVAAAIHAEPLCRPFDELDVYEFIGACASFKEHGQQGRGKA